MDIKTCPPPPSPLIMGSRGGGGGYLGRVVYHMRPRGIIVWGIVMTWTE